MEKPMKSLIYKRTHSGDPDPVTGIFGCNECMKRVRGWDYDAIIGVGGIGMEPIQEEIARKLTWVGIRPKRVGVGDDGHPLVSFDHFLYYGEHGPLLGEIAPALAQSVYDGGVRLIWDYSLSEKARKDVEKIINLAKDVPPSGQIGNRFPATTSQNISGTLRASYGCGVSATDKGAAATPSAVHMKDGGCRRGIAAPGR
jgi:hypothetical protein